MHTSHKNDAAAAVLTEENCSNCNTLLTGKYCTGCGQKRIDEEEYSLKHFMAHALHDFTHFDTKFFRSVKVLFGKPGKITADWLAGKRGGYMAPVQLYIIANILFFFVMHFLRINIFTTPLAVHQYGTVYGPLATEMVQHHLQLTHESYAAYEHGFNARMSELAHSLVVIMIPLLAVITFLLYAKQRKYFVTHLIYQVHLFTFFLLFTVTIFPVIAILVEIVMGLSGTNMGYEDIIITIIMSAFLFTYLYISSKRVYQNKPLPVAVKSLVLAISFWWVIYLYRFVLFMVVYYLL